MPRLLASVLGRDRATEAHSGSNRHAAQWAVSAVAYACGTWLANSMPMRRLALRHRGDAFYGTARAPLPEGRATTVTISLSAAACCVPSGTVGQGGLARARGGRRP